MSILYNRIVELCDSRGITGYKLCKDTGLSPGIITDLKMGRRQSLSAKNADRIASYFGVTVGYLLGTEEKEKTPTQEGERQMAKNELKFALFGTEDIDDELLDEVQRFADFAKERRDGKSN